MLTIDDSVGDAGQSGEAKAENTAYIVVQSDVRRVDKSFLRV